MEPIDKFGNQIYPSTYQKMKHFAAVLLRHGYSESVRRSNLFWKKDDEERGVTYFADMRGTAEVPLWKDPHPLFYVKFDSNRPMWKQRRIFRSEFSELGVCRAKFYEEFEPDGLLFGEGGDGYCVVCGKDFQNEGDFCSDRCKEAYSDLGKERCRVCGKVLEFSKVISHHIEYGDVKKTIEVCRSCHLKIHRSTKVPKLKPESY